MTSAPRGRVCIAVSPRMLEDTLAMALRDRDLLVAPWVADGDGGEGSERYDVAVITGPLNPDVCAESVIRLPDSRNGAGYVVVIGPGRVQMLPVPCLDDLLAMVVGLTRH